MGPAAMLTVYGFCLIDESGFFQRRSQEILALPILSVTAISFLLCACLYRHRILIILTTLSIAFFCREWHFHAAHKGIYIALAGIGFWAYSWRNDIAESLKNKPLKIWLFATGWTYFLSQFIARRAFRYLHLPLEEQLHISLEETVETTAHLMLFAASLLIWWYSVKKSYCPDRLPLETSCTRNLPAEETEEQLA